MIKRGDTVKVTFELGGHECIAVERGVVVELPGDNWLGCYKVSDWSDSIETLCTIGSALKVVKLD